MTEEPRTTGRSAALVERWRRVYAWFERQPGSGFVLAVIGRWQRVNATVLAGHIAFRTFLLLVPLLLVVVGAVGLLRNRGIDVAAEADQRFGVGGVVRAAIETVGQDAAGQATTISIVAVGSVVIATYGLLKACRAVFAFAWEIPQTEVRKGTIALLPRFLAGILLFLLAAAVRQWIAQSGIAEALAAALASFVTGSLVLLGLSWILPRRTDRLVDLLPGALVAGIGTTLISIAGAWYFSGRLERSSETYGVIGVAVTLLLYLFILSQLLVGAAVTNAEWVARDHARSGDDAPQAPSL